MTRQWKVGDQVRGREEALTLPMGTVIRSEYAASEDSHFKFEVAVRHNPWTIPVPDQWEVAGTEMPYTEAELHYPATVLWLPDEGGTAA
ncbi:hypothetical protein ACFXG4_04130 [Nocardia sp. NPDC059246]|uniref:hypothetical protein n=1 Tax=unclassified Nocardia TaxID=2637762 RepID=UPI0036BE4B00